MNQFVTKMSEVKKMGFKEGFKFGFGFAMAQILAGILLFSVYSAIFLLLLV